jgi:hypothetical protein
MIYRQFEGSSSLQAHHGTGKCMFIFCTIACIDCCNLCNLGQVTIDMLPDLALLEVFDLYGHGEQIEAWHTLVHVCRRWRNIVFGSPRRLGLRLLCKARKPVREMLDVWPPLPIVISVHGYENRVDDNIIAALEHNLNNRMCELGLWRVSSSQFKKVMAAMQRPFPELTRLALGLEDETALVVPDSFLGGSAQRLQSLFLNGIPFPGLPTLLLSATHLVDLDLWRIPHSGYISPEAMVTSLSVLTSLQSLLIGFEFPPSHPDQNRRHPPPRTRTLLPVLTELRFKGFSKYLEDLVVQIDAPLLYKLTITFFHQRIFDTPQLMQFISRTPKFKAHNEARVVFSDLEVSVRLPQTFGGVLKLAILCGQSDWQLSSLAQVCSPSFSQALIPAMDYLYILEDRASQLRWQDNIESSQWLQLLHPFTAVKGLYISREFTPRIAPALQELVGGRVTEVLPALQTLFFEEPLSSGPVRESIGRFVSARRLASHPIAVSRWERRHFE